MPLTYFTHMTTTFLGDSRTPVPVTSAFPKSVRSQDDVALSHVQVTPYMLGKGTTKLAIGRPENGCVLVRYVNSSGGGTGVPPKAKSLGAIANRLCGAYSWGSRNMAVPALDSSISFTGAVEILATA